MSQQLQQFIPVGLLLLVVLLFAAGGLLAPTLLGKKRSHNDVKDSPYECGMPPMTQAHTRFSVKFYLIAMLFILFDIEVVFFLGWAAVFRDLSKPVAEGGLGGEMLIGALVFLGILEVGHIYAWKKGALDWSPRRDRAGVERAAFSVGAGTDARSEGRGAKGGVGSPPAGTPAPPAEIA